MSTQEKSPKHWPGFSYIRLEDYELDNSFYDKELKKQKIHPTIICFLQKYCGH